MKCEYQLMNALCCSIDSCASADFVRATTAVAHRILSNKRCVREKSSLLEKASVSA